MTIDTEAARIFPSCTSREISVCGGDVLYHVRSLCSALAGGFGSPGFAGETGSSQSTLNALSAVAFEDALVPRVGSSLPSGALVLGGERGFVLVDGEGPSSQGGSIRDTRSRSTSVLGRISVGVGCIPLRPGGVRGVVGAGEVAAHQFPRNESIVFGSCSHFRSCLLVDVRQLDGDGLRQQAGRDGFLLPFLVGQPAFEVDGESRHPPQCQVSPRAVQCSGRSPQPSGSGYKDQVGPHPRVARDMLRRWGSPSIDLLATGYIAKLPYCSLVPDPKVVFEDAFRHPWGNLDLYAFAPFPLVGRVVARVRETPISPWLWPEKDWFADLLFLLTQPPVALPWWDWLLRQLHFSRFHNGICALNLHEWRLSSISSESQAFREDLLLRCPAVSAHPLSGCTRQSGCSSVVGVMEGALLQSTPLYPWSWIS